MTNGGYIEDRLVVMSVLSQINYIIEKFYSDSTEEELDNQYNKLRRSFLAWYEVINMKPENNVQQ